MSKDIKLESKNFCINMSKTNWENKAFFRGFFSVEYAYSICINSMIEGQKQINERPQRTIWYKDEIKYRYGDS